MLIKSLRNCFSASKLFAKFAMRLFLDKLNSSIEEAQLDSLETFTQCAKLTYNPNDYQEYIDSIWNSFHKLVVNSSKSSISEASLSAIQALSHSIATNLQSSNIDSGPKLEFISIEWFVQKAFDKCLPSLNDMDDLKLVWPNVKCLEAIASSNSTANILVINKVIPLLIDNYKNATYINQKKICLDILWSFVGETIKFDYKGICIVHSNLNLKSN
jgi:hypothetical protein